MKIAVLQMNVTEDPNENIEKATKLTEHLEGYTILLPELFTTGFRYPLIRSLEQNHHDIVDKLPSSNRYMGSVVRNNGDERFNSFFIKDSKGTRFPYDKKHLFPLMDEDKNFAPGNRKGIVNLDGIKCGTSICFDLRYPDRDHFCEAPQIIFAAAQWPAVRKKHLRALVSARAVENQCWFVLCNAAGNIGGALFGGGSIILTPWGETAVDAHDTEDALLTFDADLDSVTEVRKTIPIDRKP